MAAELAELIVYCQTKPGGISMTKVRNNEMKYNNMSSSTYENMLKLSNNVENKDDLIKYHEKVLSRIYPKGRNIFSGNFNPIPNWKTGAQMAALNVQTAGPYLRLNSAMFQQNGNSGYVLKPSLKKVNNLECELSILTFLFAGLRRMHLYHQNEDSRSKAPLICEAT